MEKKDNRHKVLVYGAESAGNAIPEKRIENSNFIIEFHSLYSHVDISDYDGVIFHDNIFEEKIERPGGEIIACSDEAEMQKRAKQIFKVYAKSGFICLITSAIEDTYKLGGYVGTPSAYDSYDTSLGKIILNDMGMNKNLREYSEKPHRHCEIMRDEFRNYLLSYGVTQTLFKKPYSSGIDFKAICKTTQHFLAFVLDNRIFVLPYLGRTKTEPDSIKLYSLIVNSVLNLLTKIRHEIPEWIDKDFKFPNEQELLKQIDAQKEILNKLSEERDIYRRYKQILAFGHDYLIEAVSFIFQNALKIKTVHNEKYIEDLQLYFERADKMTAIAEIKGVNAGIQREHINQIDTHREKLELSPDFPAILIVNAKMKAASLKIKDVEVASEQIKKAKSDKVLILRTLDLLNLIRLEEKGIISVEAIRDLLRTKTGWLKATAENYEILNQ